MRTVVGVVVAVLILAPLAAWAVRGVRRAAGVSAGGARPPLLVVAEGLIALAAIILGVVVVFALATLGD